MCDASGDQSVYWVWLNELQDISLSAKRRLLGVIGSPMDIFRASLDDLVAALSPSSGFGRHQNIVAECTGIRGRTRAVGQEKLQRLASMWSNRSLEVAETVLHANQEHAISFVSAQDPRYRDIFEADPQSPLVLYFRGRLAPRGVPVTAVVGSRSCSSYGTMVAKVVAGELVDQGQVVASGLSLGIEAIVHETTLTCKGISYAFLPCGLHRAQPASHAVLMERIADTGAVITPYAYGKDALPFRFIQRNRLLAAWCNALLVIEARIDSGCMRTARAALSMGKPVFSVPNSLLEPRSRGTNQLLAEGARAYLTDCLHQGQGGGPDACQTSPSDALQARVIQALLDRSMTTPEIVSLLHRSTSTVQECLAEMELANRLEFRSDGKWHLSGGL